MNDEMMKKKTEDAKALFEDVRKKNNRNGTKPITTSSVYEKTKNICYEVDNNFAYKRDVYEKSKNEKDLARAVNDCKIINFVPTYDRWCLGCGNQNPDASKKRCSGCKHVFFCNQVCQQKAWSIHKKHCGRNVFCRCATCGIDGVLPISCPDGCPVKWCSIDCRDRLISPHRDFGDCNKFKSIFSPPSE